MSEYQYHEWQAVDRLLTPKEQGEVEGLSSHIDVSPSRAVVTYEWSYFKHDPKEVLIKYFDAYFYLANWGSRQLMFRFPKGILEPDEIEKYCDGEYVSFETHGEYQVLDIDLNPEDGGDWFDGDAELSAFISLRNDLLEGDYRLLYLAWLAGQTMYGTPVYDEEETEDYFDEEDEQEDHELYEMEPPVPPGLKKLTPALDSFARAFNIDPFLIKAAAETSPDLRDAQPVNYRDLISRLPRSEVDHYLARLAEGDGGVRISLRKRLRELLPEETGSSILTSRPRALRQLVERAETLEQAEKERKAQEARRRHVAEMKSLAEREPQVWRQVDDLLEYGQKNAAVYDQATALLDKLQQLADYQGNRQMFSAHLRGLADKYSKRSALMQRWRQRGWL